VKHMAKLSAETGAEDRENCEGIEVERGFER
jgi:hypothetical protein